MYLKSLQHCHPLLRSHHKNSREIYYLPMPIIHHHHHHHQLNHHTVHLSNLNHFIMLLIMNKIYIMLTHRMKIITMDLLLKKVNLSLKKGS
ncbi:uncharacterized protein DS421_12g356060 [Arachis hypogaea]|nr:uncharacterized protein DS421_12g356060 [Arachis hypogaea]